MSSLQTVYSAPNFSKSLFLPGLGSAGVAVMGPPRTFQKEPIRPYVSVSGTIGQVKPFEGGEGAESARGFPMHQQGRRQQTDCFFGWFFAGKPTNKLGVRLKLIKPSKSLSNHHQQAHVFLWRGFCKQALKQHVPLFRGMFFVCSREMCVVIEILSVLQDAQFNKRSRPLQINQQANHIPYVSPFLVSG